MPVASLLDTDLYKLTIQQAVLEYFPDSTAVYKFKNRRGNSFHYESKSVGDYFEDNFELILLRTLTESFANLTLKDAEYKYLQSLDIFQPAYLAYLKNYRFDPSQVKTKFSENGDLDITIEGPWHSTILWEVPLMATISELYFVYVVDRWDIESANNETFKKAYDKSKFFQKNEIKYIEFGTRRRRSSFIQELVLKTLSETDPSQAALLGTSNVHFAQKFGLKPIGTFAHEWVMGCSTRNLVHANQVAMEYWSDLYNGKLGIALTDTYGTGAFLKDFDPYFARVFDGVRQDSGDPIEFANIIYDHYKSTIGTIDPKSKTIVFSDSLDPAKCHAINLHCNKLGIKAVFGIGTNLTNDFGPQWPPLNMVIKLHKLDGIPVVKLSDDEGKECGEKDAVRVANYLFKGKSL